jgi:hypothetical protein
MTLHKNMSFSTLKLAALSLSLTTEYSLGYSKYSFDIINFKDLEKKKWN